MGGIGELIFNIAQWVLLGGILLLMLPVRRSVRVRVSRVLKTTPEIAWSMLADPTEFTPENRSDNPLLIDTIVAYHKLPDDPHAYELKLDLSKGQGKTFAVLRGRMLVFEPPHRAVNIVESFNGVPFPFGKDSNIEVVFDAVPEGVRVTQTHVMQVRNLLHELSVRFTAGKQLNRAQQYFAIGSVAPAAAAGWQGLAARLTLTAAAAGSFALAFGWLFGIGLALVFLLHEFGHWLAMRLRGYRHARLTLVPFLGGVANAGQPFKSQFDRAFCVLMGPGLSAALCCLLAGASSFADGPNRLVGPEAAAGIDWFALLRAAIPMIGLVNLSQLIPVMPLDGGQLLRLLIHSERIDIARWVSLAIGGAACLAAIYYQQYLLAPLALIGVAMLGQRIPAGAQGPAMTVPQRLAIAAGTVAATAALTAASAPILADFAGFNSVHSAVAHFTGRVVPMPGSTGSKTVPPGFTITSALVSDLDRQTYVRGGDGIARRQERINFGYTDDPGANASIKTVDMSAERNVSTPISDLREYIEGLDDTAGSDPVTIAPGTTPIDIHWNRGTAVALAYSALPGGNHKSCLAFHGYLRDGQLYLIGQYCPAAGKAAAPQDVICFLDGLTFTGEATVPASPGVTCAASSAASQ